MAIPSRARAERVKAELQQQQRQIEYEEFKKKRRLVGAGDVEKVERADQVTDLIIKLKTHQISREEFNAYWGALIAGRRARGALDAGRGVKSGDKANPDSSRASKALMGRTDGDTKQSLLTADLFAKQTPFDPRLSEEQRRQIAVRLLAVLEEKGPNDFPVGFLKNGDKVEWLPSEPEDIEEGADSFWPMPLLRNEDEIHTATEQAAAKRIEDKYGRENLGWNDFEWGMVNGKLSALRWVGGSEWDFLDT